MKKITIGILISLLPFLLSGCNDTLSDVETELIINLSALESTTRAALDPDALELKDAAIWIKDGKNVRKLVSKSGLSGKTVSMNCGSLPSGTYDIYVVANTEAYTVSPLLNGTTASESDFKSIVFSPFAENVPALTQEAGMPLSIQKQIEVTPGIGPLSVYLKRVPSLVTVTVHNQVPNTNVYVENISFASKNKKSTYLFANEGLMPSGSYTSFPSYSLSSDSDYVAPLSDKQLMKFYAYESLNINPLSMTFRCALTNPASKVQINNSIVSNPQKDFSSTIGSLTCLNNNGESETITDLLRGENLNIDIYIYYQNASVKLYYEVQFWNTTGDHITSFD